MDNKIVAGNYSGDLTADKSFRIHETQRSLTVVCYLSMQVQVSVLQS